MSGRTRLAPAAILATGAAAVLLMTSPAVQVPGHEALRFTQGFRTGRWDARFLIARGPAAVVLPHPARITLTLSGPAGLTMRSAGATVAQRSVGKDPEPGDFRVGADGRLDLAPDGAVRLHALRIERDGPWPTGRLALVVVATALALVLAWRRHPAAGAIVQMAAVAAAVAGDFAATVLKAQLGHFRPVLLLLGLLAVFLAVVVLGRRRRRPAPASRLPLLFGTIVFASAAAQVLLLPQPLLIGDPAAYHDIGGRFAAALRHGLGPAALADAAFDLRPYGGLVFTGLLYGALRAVHDSLTAIYLVQALAMGAAAAFLVRAAVRVGGPRRGVWTGALAALYPTFPVLCGIVQPEPFILMLWTWAFDGLVAARGGEDPQAFALPGLAFGLGLALHPQGIWFLLIATALTVLPVWALFGPRAQWRSLAFFAVGLLPVAATTAVGEAYARPAAQVLDERYGFWAYTARVPLGFWLFIDTDGWQGPVRIDETRYAIAFRAEEQSGRLGTSWARLAFTGRFVAQNARDSVRTVLRNLHRLLQVPDNPFHRDWILPYSLHLHGHRAVVVLFVVSIPLLVRAGTAAGLVPVVILCLTYPLYHIFNKYAVPSSPFLLFGAAVALERLRSERPRRLLLGLALAAAGAVWAPASLAFLGVPPIVAHGFIRVLHLSGLIVAGLEAARLWATGAFDRWVLGACGFALLLATLAASWDDPRWRRFEVAVDDGAFQEIAPGAEALDALTRSSEAYVVFDLRLPDGDPKDVQIEFDTGLRVGGGALEPTMPPFGLATLRGGRDPNRFAQWWRLRWRPEMGADGRVGMTVRGAADTRLAGELDAPGDGSVHEGLSLGYWPTVSVYRLMHDGEYRLAVRQRVDAARRVSRLGIRGLPGTFGIRLVRLDDDAGGTVWETAPAPAGPRVVAVWARAGRSARATMSVPGAVPLRFDLGPGGPWIASGAELRHVPAGDHEGWYLLRLLDAPAGPLRMSVRPLLEMNAAPKYFLAETRAEPPTLPPDWEGLPVSEASRIVEAREAPRWRPLAVY